MKSPMCKQFFSALIFTLFTAGAVQAQTANDANETSGLKNVLLQPVDSHPHKFKLQFANVSSERVLLTILDAQGNALFHQKIENYSFRQTFDLSTLQDGSYTFVLSMGKEVVKKMVELNTDLIVVKKAYIK